MRRIPAHPAFAVAVSCLEFVPMVAIAAAMPDMSTDFFGSVAKAALVGGLCGGAGAFLAFGIGPMLGILSDRVGRLPCLFFVEFLNALPSFALAMPVTLWAYFGATVLSGSSALGVCFAYVADVTEGRNRARWFALSSAGVFLAFVFGPLIDLADGQTAFYICSGVWVAHLFMIAVIMPESLKKRKAESPSASGEPGTQDGEESPMPDNAEEEHAFDPPASAASGGATSEGEDPDHGATPTTAASSPLGSKSDSPTHVPESHISYNPFFALKHVTSSPLMLRVSVLSFFFGLVETGLISTVLLFFKDQLDFTRTDSAGVLMLLGVSGFLTLAVLMPFLLRLYSQRIVIMISLFVNAIRLSFYFFVKAKWTAYAIESFAGLSFMTFPAASNLVAQHTPADEQGLAQGALSGVRGLAYGLGPVLFSGLFSYFTSNDAPFQFPQAPFVLADILLAVALIFAYMLPDEKVVPSAAEVEEEAREECEHLEQPLLSVQDDKESATTSHYGSTQAASV